MEGPTPPAWTNIDLILEGIFDALPIEDLKSCRGVCKKWHLLATPLMAKKAQVHLYSNWYKNRIEEYIEYCRRCSALCGDGRSGGSSNNLHKFRNYRLTMDMKQYRIYGFLQGPWTQYIESLSIFGLATSDVVLLFQQKFLPLTLPRLKSLEFHWPSQLESGDEVTLDLFRIGVLHPPKAEDLVKVSMLESLSLDLQRSACFTWEFLPSCSALKKLSITARDEIALCVCLRSFCKNYAGQSLDTFELRCFTPVSFAVQDILHFLDRLPLKTIKFALPGPISPVNQIIQQYQPSGSDVVIEIYGIDSAGIKALPDFFQRLMANGYFDLEKLVFSVLQCSPAAYDYLEAQYLRVEVRRRHEVYLSFGVGYNPRHEMSNWIYRWISSMFPVYFPALRYLAVCDTGGEVVAEKAGSPEDLFDLEVLVGKGAETDGGREMMEKPVELQKTVSNYHSKRCYTPSGFKANTNLVYLASV